MSVVVKKVAASARAVARTSLRMVSLAVLATLITMSLYGAAGAHVGDAADDFRVCRSW